MVKYIYVLEILVFVLARMKGSNANVPTEFWRKPQQDGQAWRNSSRLNKIRLVRSFPYLDVCT